MFLPPSCDRILAASHEGVPATTFKSVLQGSLVGVCVLNHEEFRMINNLRIVFNHEGFTEVGFKYLGGYRWKWNSNRLWSIVVCLEFQDVCFKMGYSTWKIRKVTTLKEITGWIPSFNEDNFKIDVENEDDGGEQGLKYGLKQDKVRFV
ncbi:hypothetical protein L2E82_28128 [Cichorium intybus]|uniref:Uncharacterized protein n=1 Tax=Cichorium intybus TaxID=13427 RepID=A0ACB9CUY6_CICIN|nr:hypothetical protein L2E82_28128 [Cichorium intybus]